MIPVKQKVLKDIRHQDATNDSHNNAQQFIDQEKHFAVVSGLRKTLLQGNELSSGYCIMERVVTQTNHIRLDSGGQTTISGINHSNAIIICWSVRYKVSLL
jgi:hypothetical protein